ncbi:thiol-disulfide oxidoreductase DCC family protein [Flaviaesturariibacter flavus]|uniref:Thiol-disulfide oxidoreductase DCC family protein n=1 Tax=Flaviaesturariibacter flavus TaxID=2502780 RepID=A0A4R1BK48_9BACT|nr:thiol-disulfide oxidoreductase DCC family protein [Flaviaesturariibacter flavus]TCJ17676.1 thiol-disulfide oxidoreductase DCC family protein [Flaviaesturariibacter flavus]
MEHPIILFDGVCNYCNAIVNWVMRIDRKGVFRFATLQSATGQQLLQQHGLGPQAPDSVVLIEHGKAFVKSDASLRIAHHLPWWLQEVRLLWIVPRPFRDAIYDTIARNRYKWFGRKEACMVPTAEQRARFLK